MVTCLIKPNRFYLWHRGSKVIALLEGRNWPEEERVEVNTVGYLFLSHSWQRKKERLAIIGNRSDRKKAPSSRRSVVNGQITMTCKTLALPPPYAHYSTNNKLSEGGSVFDRWRCRRFYHGAQLFGRRYLNVLNPLKIARHYELNIAHLDERKLIKLLLVGSRSLDFYCNVLWRAGREEGGRNCAWSMVSDICIIDCRSTRTKSS